MPSTAQWSGIWPYSSQPENTAKGIWLSVRESR
jgi:hypothetical protein